MKASGLEMGAGAVIYNAGQGFTGGYKQKAQGSFGVATTGNFFIEEQYKQLLQLLYQSTRPIETTSHAKVRGIPLSLLSRVKQDRWIIDSGATNHMVSSLDFFTDFMEVSKVEDICNGKVNGIDKLEEGLYVLDLNHKPIFKFPNGVVTSALVVNRISGSLWHKRFGHISLDALKRLLAFHNKTFVDCNEHRTICPLAKQTRLPFPISSSRSDVFADLIHADVWRPFKNGVVARRHKYILDTCKRFKISGWTALKIMRVFGCLTYAAKLKRQHKCLPRAVPTVFLGYSLVQKGYKLYDLHNHCMFASRDVIFKEDVFPFLQQMNSTMQDQQFPVIAPNYDSDDSVLISHNHSIKSQNTSSPELGYLDGSADATPPQSPSIDALHESSASHTTPSPFTDVLPTSDDDESTVDGIRKPTRPSIWMNDYVVEKTAGKSKPCTYPISNFFSYQALKPAYNQCLVAYSVEVEPSSLSEAVKDLKWVSATSSFGKIMRHGEGCSQVHVLIFVDDLLVTGSHSELIDKTRAQLQKFFKMKDIGELKFFLGIEFARSSKCIYMSKRKYALELIAELGLAGSKTASTPLEVNQKLTSIEFDKAVAQAGVADNDSALKDASVSQRLVGRLLY
ncbi:PREDICTED: uncharacterized protein LOC109208056 [Nicotiana attenuata]|uniref:uncharacterized protein LOC109208056 n=1 Tax=Nicotiana attenuata TaxID=49451 RepID=UPI000904F2C0|nr:PREDICTED: uncharacterized protein LOC109208056 [Nicotiana attenuata]